MIVADALSEEERTYLSVHGRRLDFVVALVQRLLGSSPGAGRILDVGPHFLTERLRERTAAKVDQLGFANDRLSHPRAGERHYQLDLNDAADRARWPALPQYDVVLACEVIEHLHVSPAIVLAFLRTCVAPGGYLVLQTPNAVALKRRLVMLAGRNPYDRIRETTENPGHFREYTRAELVEYAGATGFEVVAFDSLSYFDYSARGLAGRAYGAVTHLLPASLRDGMTITLRRAR